MERWLSERVEVEKLIRAETALRAVLAGVDPQMVSVETSIDGDFYPPSLALVSDCFCFLRIEPHEKMMLSALELFFQTDLVGQRSIFLVDDFDDGALDLSILPSLDRAEVANQRKGTKRLHSLLGITQQPEGISDETLIHLPSLAKLATLFTEFNLKTKLRLLGTSPEFLRIAVPKLLPAAKNLEVRLKFRYISPDQMTIIRDFADRGRPPRREFVKLFKSHLLGTAFSWQLCLDKRNDWFACVLADGPKKEFVTKLNSLTGLKFSKFRSHEGVDLEGSLTEEQIEELGY